MRIALTYDLREAHVASGMDPEDAAEFDHEGTIAALVETLRALGHEPVRIGGIRALVPQLARGRLGVDLVFNIAEGRHGRAREAQVPALLEAYRIPYTFSDPLTLAVCLDKAVAKRLVREAGVPTAPFRVLAGPQDDAACDLPFPLFLKPVAEGSSKGTSAASRVGDRAALAEVASRLRRRFRQPVLAEVYLPGREVTVGIAGPADAPRPLGVMEILVDSPDEPGIYSFANKQQWRQRVRYAPVRGPLAEEAAAVAAAAYRALGCRDVARIDLRQDADGRLVFLEANPLPGLNPEEGDLPILARAHGIDYRALIALIIAEASARLRRRERRGEPDEAACVPS